VTVSAVVGGGVAQDGQVVAGRSRYVDRPAPSSPHGLLFLKGVGFRKRVVLTAAWSGLLDESDTSFDVSPLLGGSCRTSGSDA
jgi:hypothetical protein